MSDFKTKFEIEKAPNGYSVIARARHALGYELSCAGHDREDALVNLSTILNDMLVATKEKIVEMNSKKS
jgi:hypothetical protein